MKKSLFSALFVVMSFATSALAQGESPDPGFYLRAHLGYNLKAASANMSSYSRSGNTTHYEQEKVGISTGFNPGITAGYFFNRVIGAELGLAYLFGREVETDRFETSTSGKDVTTVKLSMLQIIPMLVLQFREGTKCTPYAKIGPMIGVGNSMLRTNDENDPSGVTSHSETKFSGGVAVGLALGLGVDYKLNEKFSLFGQAMINTMSYAPTKSVLQVRTENGTDLLAGMSTAMKETEFVNSYDETIGATQDPNKPRKELKDHVPVSNLGIQVGIKMNFSK